MLPKLHGETPNLKRVRDVTRDRQQVRLRTCSPYPPHTLLVSARLPGSLPRLLLDPSNAAPLLPPLTVSPWLHPAHLPGTELEEALAVLRNVPAPGLGPNGVEETGTATQLLSEQRPESGLGAKDLHTPDPGVNAALQGAQFSPPRLPGGTPASLELSRLLGHTGQADRGPLT